MEVQEEEEEPDQSSDISILNDYIKSMCASSGHLILKMKYRRSGDSGEMIQQVQKYNKQAKKMLKVEDEKKMLDRLKNSEFEQIEEKFNKNEDLTDINANQKRPLEFWIRRAAAQLIIKREEEENREKDQLNQLQYLNAANSIINEEPQSNEKREDEKQIFNQNEKVKQIIVTQEKGIDKSIKLENSNIRNQAGSFFGMNGGTQSNNNIQGIYQGNSNQQNSTLPQSCNIPQIVSKMNELSNIQNGSNLIFNSNIHNNNHNMSEDLILQNPPYSPKSNHELIPPYSSKSQDKQAEDPFFNQQFSTTNLTNNRFLEQKQGQIENILNFSKQNNNQTTQNPLQIQLHPASQSSQQKQQQMTNSKDIDFITPYSNQMNQKTRGNNLENDMGKNTQRSSNQYEKYYIEVQYKDTREQHDNEFKATEKNEEKYKDIESQVSKPTKSKQNNKNSSKNNLTALDDRYDKSNEPLIDYNPKRTFTIEHFKGVLFIKKSTEVYRKVTIGSFMEGDDIFVLLSIEKDFQIQEKKINQLRDLLNQYEQLYLQSLKCLKNLTYDAYLDIPQIEYQDRFKNNFDTIWNKNNSLHLQLKVIINKIINLKDVLNLQKSIKRNKLQVENMDVIELLNELKSDFKSILEERNVTLQVQNPLQISNIINSPKRVKQVLFNVIHNAIKNTENNFSVQITLDYYKENNRIISLHIIHKIKQNTIIPTQEDRKLDIKEILKTASKASNRKSKTKKNKKKNLLQIGLRVSDKLLALIGPRHGFIMKKVLNTFQTQILIFSDTSENDKLEKLTKIQKEMNQKQEEVRNLFYLASMQILVLFSILN